MSEIQAIMMREYGEHEVVHGVVVNQLRNYVRYLERALAAQHSARVEAVEKLKDLPICG